MPFDPRDPAQREELRKLLKHVHGCWHCGADLMATEGTARAVDLYDAVPALLAEVERLTEELRKARA